MGQQDEKMFKKPVSVFSSFFRVKMVVSGAGRELKAKSAQSVSIFVSIQYTIHCLPVQQPDKDRVVQGPSASSTRVVFFKHF